MSNAKPDSTEKVVEMTPDLVAKLREGDAQAGRILDEIYRAAIVRFCTGYLGKVDEAEDATQEVFCRVLASSKVPENFRAYLYKTARNYCLNVKRKSANRDKELLATNKPRPDTQTGHLTRLMRKEQHSRLAKLVESLSDGQREALRLRYAEGLSRSEIAEVLDEPESIIKSRLYEGIKKLREHPSLITGL